MDRTFYGTFSSRALLFLGAFLYCAYPATGTAAGSSQSPPVPDLVAYSAGATVSLSGTLVRLNQVVLDDRTGNIGTISLPGLSETVRITGYHRLGGEGDEQLFSVGSSVNLVTDLGPVLIKPGEIIRASTNGSSTTYSVVFSLDGLGLPGVIGIDAVTAVGADILFSLDSAAVLELHGSGGGTFVAAASDLVRKHADSGAFSPVFVARDAGLHSPDLNMVGAGFRRDPGSQSETLFLSFNTALFFPGTAEVFSAEDVVAYDLTNRIWLGVAFDASSGQSGLAGGGTHGIQAVAVAFFGDGIRGLGEQCDDGNTVNGDCCSATGQFETGPCDDGNACTVSDTCSLGSCIDGPTPDCDDNNICTDDSCDVVSGCVNAANSSPCDDGNACTTSDVCSGGSCLSGPLRNCSDGNVCTNDGCDTVTGCVSVANALSCDDGDACTVGDSCSAGVCSPGATVSCDDGDPCTADACDAISGCVNSTNPGCGDISNCSDVALFVPDPVRCALGSQCSVPVSLGGGAGVDSVSGALASDLALTCASGCSTGSASVNGLCEANAGNCAFFVGDLVPPIESFNDGEVANLTIICDQEGSGRLCVTNVSAGSGASPLPVCGMACSAFDCTGCTPGDCNQSGAVDAGDPVATVLCMVGQAGPGTDCSCSADCNCVAGLEASDATCAVLRLLDGLAADPCAMPPGGALTIDLPSDGEAAPATVRLKTRKARPKAGSRRMIAGMRIAGGSAPDVAGLRMDVSSDGDIIRVRLARRLRKAGFSLTRGGEGQHARLVVGPPAELPIPGMGRGKIIRLVLSDGSTRLRVDSAEFGSTAGLPLR